VSVHVIGSMLVRNEDRFVERAIRNVAGVCERIYVQDHMSTDRTWEILQGVARDLDHVELRRSPRTTDSHKPLERYTGTPTWALGVDGDELFDPAALKLLLDALRAGEHADVFRLKGHVLNCEDLDRDRGTASGYMSPPSRPITKLFNLGAVESWSGSYQRLHSGLPVFRPGYDWDSMRYLSEATEWDDDPLRCLHVCFLRRSSQDEDGAPRKNVNETGEYDRSLLGALKRKFKGPYVPPDVAALHKAGKVWKRDWYARGERITVDATPFLGHGA
jgi:glycosyltransferase involved in cell wall biosynthesis